MSQRIPVLLGAALGAAACATAPSSPTWPAVIASQELTTHVGQRVSVSGRKAVEIWQHLVGGVAGKAAVYFDLAGGQQIVVHVAQPWDCAGEVELAGTVLEVKGPSKRPGKVDETYVEYALDVDAWRCAQPALPR